MAKQGFGEAPEAEADNGGKEKGDQRNRCAFLQPRLNYRIGNSAQQIIPEGEKRIPKPVSRGEPVRRICRAGGGGSQSFKKTPLRHSGKTGQKPVRSCDNPVCPALKGAGTGNPLGEITAKFLDLDRLLNAILRDRAEGILFFCQPRDFRRCRVRNRLRLNF